MCKLQNEYNKSLSNYKKVLHISWTEKGNEALKYEIIAYEGLALTNYYLGKVETASFYHDRVICGKTENSESAIKKVVASIVQSLRYDKQRRMNDGQT